jgi:tungstate transport system substrate-binding protein
MLSTVSGNPCAAAGYGENNAAMMINAFRVMERLLWAALICGGAAACTSEASALRVGTTYTVEQSGALAILDSLHPPAPVTVVVGPSGQILRSAAAGDLDVALTHAPTLEQRLLVAAGHVALRCPFVASRFAIVGPAADPAGVARASGAADALRRIAAAAGGAGRGGGFVSRGDSSGTHVKEVALWEAAGISPGGRPWYVQSGADQAATVRIADEHGAYALVDLPTFARLAGVELRVLFTGDSALVNPYTLYVIRSTPSPHAAAQFGAWALAAWRERLLALRLPDGTAAFAPRPGGCAAPAAGAP